jgi:hypothetical protein
MRAQVEQWWQGVFDVDDELWSSVTVLHPHGELGDYEGWYVAWRDAGVHVSAPSSAHADDVASLSDEGVAALQDTSFWTTFAKQRELDVIGPSTHFYLDDDPGPADDVLELTIDQLAQLRASVRPEEWAEGGMADEPPPPVRFGVLDGGAPIAAAVLNDWRERPSDIGVVVAGPRRGEGLSAVVGRHAASYAVSRHGIARWRAATTNVASSRTARRLGFEPYATQLAIRRGSSTA